MYSDIENKILTFLLQFVVKFDHPLKQMAHVNVGVVCERDMGAW